jgi:carbonic anhydrase
MDLPQADTDRLLSTAVAERRIVTFMLDECRRIAEPHDYGIIDGEARLFFYQIGGASRSGPPIGWRWGKLPKISALKILADRFPGPRPAPSGHHIQWDVLIATVSPRSVTHPVGPQAKQPATIAGHEALEHLQEGNRRFASGQGSVDGLSSRARRAELVTGQQPFAIVLGCSDSRVPAEIVFDQGLGDLFVIRVAGNVVAPSQIGSVEFAAERYGTRLVVVLGHSQCGAVLATLEALRRPDEASSRNLRSIVDRIRPSIEALLATELAEDLEALLPEAVRANVRVSANHLRHGSEVLERLIEQDGLLVVGAEYSLETGMVHVFDGGPEAAPP